MGYTTRILTQRWDDHELKAAWATYTMNGRSLQIMEHDTATKIQKQDKINQQTNRKQWQSQQQKNLNKCLSKALNYRFFWKNLTIFLLLSQYGHFFSFRKVKQEENSFFSYDICEIYIVNLLK